MAPAFIATAFIAPAFITLGNVAQPTERPSGPHG